MLGKVTTFNISFFFFCSYHSAQGKFMACSSITTGPKDSWVIEARRPEKFEKISQAGTNGRGAC
jgi:hypothetical protein